jgi:glycosyltransferase involved in cell wall biosynthesis
VTAVSFYFFAGDFADVMRRYKNGDQQIYQTHNEVARLIHDLLNERHQVNIYSFVTQKRNEEQVSNGLRVINLGASDYSSASLLKTAVEADNAEAIIAHFPNLELLRAVAASKRRAVAVLANSYNRTSLWSLIERRRIVNLLNDSRFELVSNHCLPATEHLAKIGVSRSKLIAWDVCHPFEPADYGPKLLATRETFELMYVGSIVEAKGVTDLIAAVSLLRERGLEVHCSLAGLGDVGLMKELAQRLGVSDLLSFLGLVGNEEIFKKMREADIVAVPSRTYYTEGFPLVMFEAIASRTPIICSDHPMFRPVMIEGLSATVFPAGNPKAFADAIARTLTDADRYANLSLAAISTWQSLKGPADWRTMLRKWVDEGISSPWLQLHKLEPVVT